MKKLNKFISDAGYCSRRQADKYIAEGRVTVNRAEAGLGSMVEEGDLVEVDGERVGRSVKRRIYIAFNKPVGVTSTTDPADKDNIVDYIAHKERIFHVGRLDKDSEGLIILTNDGDIVNKILRAGNENPKEYVVTVDKPITADFVRQMSSGVRILGTLTKQCKVVKKGETTFVIHLTQGLNRQIRRMCHALGYKVTGLRRVKVMNIPLGNLAVGQWRYFTSEETAEMHRLLESSIGTQEASFIPRVNQTTVKGSYAHYRKKGHGTKSGASYSRDNNYGKNINSEHAAGDGKVPGGSGRSGPSKASAQGRGSRPAAKSQSKATSATGGRSGVKAQSKSASGAKRSAAPRTKTSGAASSRGGSHSPIKRRR